jgi:hypothetical protein
VCDDAPVDWWQNILQKENFSMNNSRKYPFSFSARLFLMVTLVFTLMLSSAQTALAASLATVDLGKASSFVILTKAGITNVPASKITGDMGVSPIAATAITGFALVADSSNTFSRSAQVTGKIYAADYASPTPAKLTTAVSNMEAAYTDAAGRTNPDFTELGAGDISGLTLAPGLYKWGTSVVAYKNVTLNGGPNAIWIFQISGNLTLASGVRITLAGGAQAKNIFWQVAGGAGVNLGTTSHFEGTILAKTGIQMTAGASLNGRALAQTAVTLISNVLVIPTMPLGKK